MLSDDISQIVMCHKRKFGVMSWSLLLPIFGIFYFLSTFANRFAAESSSDVPGDYLICLFHTLGIAQALAMCTYPKPG